MQIVKYRFTTGIDTVPIFTGGTIDSNYVDVVNGDGTTTRTINGSALPTAISFKGKTGLKELIDIDTSNVNAVNSMFDGCTGLTSLDLSSFNTSNVFSMNSMFNGCTSLISVDLSNFNTSKVVTMQYMFCNCPSLASLNLSSFDTSEVGDMYGMFNKCSSLTTLNLSGFNTSKVTNMGSMFRDCSKLTSLDLSSFNTSKVTNMSNMFYNCSSLISINLSNFDTSNVTNMEGVFKSCLSLKSLDLSNFNTSKVTTFILMFEGCKALISLDLSNFDFNDTVNVQQMFYHCSKLETLDISNFNLSVSLPPNMFIGAGLVKKINLKKSSAAAITRLLEILPNNTNKKVLYVSSEDCKITNSKNWSYKTIKESEQTFILDEPIRSLSENLKDRLYWDNVKGHYCIERKSKKYTVTNTNFVSSVDNPSTWIFYTLVDDGVKGDNVLRNFLLEFPYNVNLIRRFDGVYYFTAYKSDYPNVEELNNMLNGKSFIYELGVPEIIDLPQYNKKLNLNLYSPTTHMNFGENNIKPNKIILSNDLLKFIPLNINSNKDYTLQFDCSNVGAEQIKINLCGAEKLITPTLGTNQVQIRTLDTPTSDLLELSGEGSIVEDVMLFENIVTQKPKYFEGIQGVSNKIKIITENYPLKGGR